MHRFVTSAFFFFASSLIACSSGQSASSPGSSQGALADKGGTEPGDKGGGTTCDPGKGDGCITQGVSGCQDYAQLKAIVAKACGAGLTITAVEFGPACGDGKADGVKYTCCAAPPSPPPACKDIPIPPEICKDPVAVKEYAVTLCASPSLSLPDGDPCSPKAAVECCDDAAPSPPPKK